MDHHGDICKLRKYKEYYREIANLAILNEHYKISQYLIRLCSRIEDEINNNDEFIFARCSGYEHNMSYISAWAIKENIKCIITHIIKYNARYFDISKAVQYNNIYALSEFIKNEKVKDIYNVSQYFLDEGLIAKYANVEMLKFLIHEKWITPNDDIIESCYQFGNIDLVEHFSEIKGLYDQPKYTYAAARGTALQILNIMIKRTPDDISHYDKTLVCEVSTEVIKMLVSSLHYEKWGSRPMSEIESTFRLLLKNIKYLDMKAITKITIQSEINCIKYVLNNVSHINLMYNVVKYDEYSKTKNDPIWEKIKQFGDGDDGDLKYYMLSIAVGFGLMGKANYLSKNIDMSKNNGELFYKAFYWKRYIMAANIYEIIRDKIKIYYDLTDTMMIGLLKEIRNIRYSNTSPHYKLLCKFTKDMISDAYNNGLPYKSDVFSRVPSHHAIYKFWKHICCEGSLTKGLK